MLHRMSFCFVIYISMLLAGCGGSAGTMSSLPSSAPRFVNQTDLPEDQFQHMAESKWQQAQSDIATKPIDLKAAWRDVNHQPADPLCISGAIACNGFIKPDPRAVSVEPRGVTVRSLADLPASADTPRHPTNPTGIIACPGYDPKIMACAAYLDFPCKISVPTSKPQNMGPYEMQTCILRELGYPTDGR